LLLSFRTPDGPKVSAADPRLALGAATPAPTQAVSGDGSTRAARTPTSTSTPAPTQTATTRAQQVVDGKVVNTRYGPVQVEVTLKGSTITDVQALELPSDRRTSAEISQTVAPWLHDEVLQAQSANIDIISGATYTSTAYAESLQSALDSVG
jgi:uncharacterized protein with FMN-binding domain